MNVKQVGLSDPTHNDKMYDAWSVQSIEVLRRREAKLRVTQSHPHRPTATHNSRCRLPDWIGSTPVCR